MQVTFEQLNEVTKEINLTIPSEEVSDAYEKYLYKVSKDVNIPGFRKGKAPLNMLERLYADKIKEDFYNDYCYDAFMKAVKEYDIHYLLYPDVKDISWEKGNDMTIKIEIEYEPTLELKQIEGLTVPIKPILLEDKVEDFINEIAMKNSIVKEVETVESFDEIEVDINVQQGNDTQTILATFSASPDEANKLPELIGHHKGDTVQMKLSGKQIRDSALYADIEIEDETEYPCEIVIQTIKRKIMPELDDELAKDMEYDSMEDMRASISEEMRLRNEHFNMEIENAGIISEYFAENPFALPEKTIQYMVMDRMGKVKDEQLANFLYTQLRFMYTQDIIRTFILDSLLQKMPIELTDDMMEEYMTHMAIYNDIPVEAYKEKREKDTNIEDLRESAKEYFLLRQIAKTCSFVLKEETPDEQNLDMASDDTKEE
ncbi:MAG: trigger factor [Candidatus Cloacimonas sp.]